MSDDMIENPAQPETPGFELTGVIEHLGKVQEAQKGGPELG